MVDLWQPGKRWLKGNLHAHTTASDGQKSIEECIQIYKEHGYDFLAITDHRKRFIGYQDEQILVIPAAEYHRNFINKAPEHAYHITGVGLEYGFVQDDSFSPQEIVDAIHAAGGFCTLAHPSWSMMTFDEVKTLQDYDAIEIYNTISDVYSGRGYSDQYIDMLASQGIYKRITAVDDVHHYDRDIFGGYIMVQAEHNNWKEIRQALMENRFYASQGPEIKRIQVEGNHVSVDVSPVECIRFMTNSLHNGKRTILGTDLTHGEYTLAEHERYVRIEAYDAEGRACWSNIIPRGPEPVFV